VWLVPAGISAIAVLVVVAVAVALIGARASSPRTAEGFPTSAAFPASDRSFHEAEDQPSPPPGSEVSRGTEFVQIANTGGVGAYLRREPYSTAARIIAHRDGTVLRIAGPDATTDGQVWRQVEDARGSRGWTPSEYLTPTDLTF
jgi:hypothetical protein